MDVDWKGPTETKKHHPKNTKHTTISNISNSFIWSFQPFQRIFAVNRARDKLFGSHIESSGWGRLPSSAAMSHCLSPNHSGLGVVRSVVASDGVAALREVNIRAMFKRCYHMLPFIYVARSIISDHHYHCSRLSLSPQWSSFKVLQLWWFSDVKRKSTTFGPNKHWSALKASETPRLPMFTVGVRCGSQTSLTPRVYPKILPKYHTLITRSVVVIGGGQAFNQESPWN